VTVDQDRSASLLVRVWLEGGAGQFRARLTSVDTSPETEDDAGVSVGVASSPGDVITFIETWLRTFVAPGACTGKDTS
jgi:hypothetical protein